MVAVGVRRPDPLLSKTLLATDEDLVAMLQAGCCEPAMAGIQQRYERRLFHFVSGMVRDTHLAQDIVQEVMQKVLLKNDLYQPGTNFRGWIFEIARNQALSVWRTHRRLPLPVSALHSPQQETSDLLASIEAGPPDRSLEEQEFMSAFESAVEELPEHYRTVFDLCVRQGRSYQQAANQLAVPTGTIAIRIMRARRRLFNTLERHLDRLRRPPACFQ